MVVIVVVVVIMIVVMVVMLLALHVDAAMKIAVRLMDHRRADRGLRIAERDGKRVVALHNLRHARALDVRESERQHCGEGGKDRSWRRNPVWDCASHQTRFRLRITCARKRHAAEYTAA